MKHNNQIQAELELTKLKLRIAEKALNDILQWGEGLDDEWSNPSECANSALEKIMTMDGF